MTNLIERKFNKDKFLATNPTKIGTVFSDKGQRVDFFEHPFHGDESPLVAIIGDQCGLTGFWDLPEKEEL